MTALIHDKQTLRRRCEEARARGEVVGVVPTMGALHAGHLRLVDAARERGATFVMVTVFVNPLQFGPSEDFQKYPRTLDGDLVACRGRDVDVVFAPTRDEMYPPGFGTHVEVTTVSSPLEGAHRPGHFRGVTTIVAKLLALSGPCVAVFGRKDYQQWRVIERMVADLDLPAEVHGIATVREPDGLALSSRNAYLDDAQRRRALGIARGLRNAALAHAAGERRAAVLEALASAPVSEAFDQVDYVSVRHPDTLEPLGDDAGARVLVAVAARIGSTRLIDNLVLGEDTPPEVAPTDDAHASRGSE